MLALIPTLFTLFYYSTLLKFPMLIGNTPFVLAIDLITPFLYVWLIFDNRNALWKKALIAFFSGLATDIFLLNSIYFNTIAYLLLVIFIDATPRLKKDRFLRFFSFVGYYFMLILLKSVILAFLGKVEFFSYFLSNALLLLPLTAIIGLLLLRQLVRLINFISEPSKKKQIKTELT